MSDTREQLQARERELAGQRRRQEDFLGLCQDITLSDPGRKESLIREQRRKLTAIEDELHGVRTALERLPAATPPAAPTPS